MNLQVKSKNSKPLKEIMENNTENRQIIDLAAALSNAQKIGDSGIPYSVIPYGYEVHDLEKLLEIPARKRGQIALNDAQSFINYFIKHSEQGSIYAEIDPPKFIAVLDDHKSSTPGWRGHIANYSCPLSKEWKIWTNSNKRVMKQSEFAQFIEDNLLDIVDPPGADMLEISRSLEAKKKVNFASAIRLSNGQTELTYEEEIQGTAAKGKLNIPELFSLGIPVLDGTDPYRVDARLRYRITDGSLVIWYDLLRPHKVLESAVMDVWVEIETKTEQKIFNGQPF